MLKTSWLALLVGFVGLFVTLSSIATARESQEATAVSYYLPLIQSTISLNIIPFAEGLPPPANPTDMIDPGDGRLFVAMKDGRVLIINRDGSIEPKPLLDIRDVVFDIHSETGLVGLTAHPNYAQNGYIYTFFNSLIDGELYSKLSRFMVVDNVAAPDSEMIMLQLLQKEIVHQGGAIRFGPKDGYLYVSIGDDSQGTLSGKHANSQSGTLLLGKVLRIDVDSAQPYAIPADNPFVHDPLVLDEIWALGLRNPWRINFDRHTGDLYIGDVGNDRWEEIDFQAASSNGGENYGWPCFEGPDPHVIRDCGQESDYVAPYFYYPHTSPDRFHCAVIGGTAYRGSLMPKLVGHYFFTDYCAGNIYTLYYDQIGELVVGKWGEFNRNWHTIAERSDGELFMGAANTDTIYQIVPRDN